MRLRCHAVVDTAFQQVQVWKNDRQCEFRVAGAIHAWWHEKRYLTGLAWDNIAAAALLRREGPPRSILMLGLAGGTAMRILRHLLPECRLVAVDIDSEIVALAELNMRLDELGIEVHIADAYQWLAQNDEQFDVVIDDLFLTGATDVVRSRVPEGDTLALLRQRVAPGGVVVANLITDVGEHSAVRRRARAAFRAAFASTRVVHPPRGLNEILVGGDTVQPGTALKAFAGALVDVEDAALFRAIRVRKL
jgi:predicted membrane-bound spermidine synthase